MVRIADVESKDFLRTLRVDIMESVYRGVETRYLVAYCVLTLFYKYAPSIFISSRATTCDALDDFSTRYIRKSNSWTVFPVDYLSSRQLGKSSLP